MNLAAATLPPTAASMMRRPAASGSPSRNSCFSRVALLRVPGFLPAGLPEQPGWNRPRPSRAAAGFSRTAALADMAETSQRMSRGFNMRYAYYLSRSAVPPRRTGRSRDLADLLVDHRDGIRRDDERHRIDELGRAVRLAQDRPVDHAEILVDPLAVGGGVEDLHARPAELRHVGDLEAVDAGHDDVGEDQIDVGPRLEQDHGLDPVRGGDHLEAGLGEQLVDQRANLRLVLDDENGRAAQDHL